MSKTIPYTSTRDKTIQVSCRSALLEGLAPDGGLFVPTVWPKIHSAQREKCQGDPLAALLLAWQSFAGESRAFFEPHLTSALASFPQPHPLPLYPLDAQHSLLDLTGGPTLSFKDVAMQCLGSILPALLGNEERLILGATSGDTGPAALYGFRGRLACAILYPLHGVSEFQRRQMTCLSDPHSYAVAIEGSFDTCQSLIKTVFTSKNHNLHLMAVNSINWGRIIAQIGYYLYATASHTCVDVTIPSGNFGNAYAAYVAKLIGAPINKITLACNQNNTLATCVTEGVLTHKEVIPTITPSMDVQIPSNLERLLHHVMSEEALHRLLHDLRAQGKATLPDDARDLIRTFNAVTVSEDETTETMRRIWHNHQILLDPHSAVAVCAAQQTRQESCPMITLMTASPVKFAQTVMRATGINPKVPPAWDDLASRKESRIVVPNDADALIRFLESIVSS